LDFVFLDEKDKEDNLVNSIPELSLVEIYWYIYFALVFKLNVSDIIKQVCPLSINFSAISIA
jgi:hypothetical protein